MQIDNWLATFYCMEELLDFILCHTILFNSPISKKKSRYVLLFGIVFTFEFIINLTFPADISSIRHLLYGLLIPLILFEKNKLKGFVTQINVYGITSIWDILIFYIYCLITNKSYADTTPMTTAVLMNCTFIIFASLVLLYSKISKKQIYRLDLSTPNLLLLTVAIISIILSISFLQYASVDVATVTQKMYNVFGLLLGIIGTIFVLTVIKLTKYIQKNTTLQYEKKIIDIHMASQREYVDTVISKDQDMRRFRHDIKGQFIALSGYMHNHDYKAANDYLSQLTSAYDDCNMQAYTGIVPVDAIISDLHKQMEQKNINLNWHGSLKDYNESSNLTAYDLCTIFINIMNNAIEACEKVPRNRFINVTASTHDNHLYIIADNPFIGNIDVINKGTIGTSKKDTINHGIGTLNIKSIVEKHSGTVKYSVEDNIFTVEILI